MPAWQRATHETWATTEAVPRIPSEDGLQSISVTLKARWRLCHKALSIWAQSKADAPPPQPCGFCLWLVPKSEMGSELFLLTLEMVPKDGLVSIEAQQ